MMQVVFETVTQMFSGLDQKTPELRVPGIRGMLRYWLRAALGGVLGDQRIEELRRLESEVFGSTDGIGAVAIRARWMNGEPKTKRENILPHHDGGRKPVLLRGFQAGLKFELNLIRRGGSTAAWSSAVAALLMMISHGGIGRRSRRGWGTLRILSAKGDLPEDLSYLLKPQEFGSPEEWLSYMKDVSTSAAKVSKGLLKELEIPVGQAGVPSRYPVVTPKTQRFIWKELFGDGLSAISKFGEREHKFLQANPKLARAFGFARNGRQASPLWVRVIPVRVGGKSKSMIGMSLLQFQFKDKDDANYDMVRRFICEYPVVY